MLKHDANYWCHNCGGSDYIWGAVTGYSAALAFKPDPQNVVPTGFGSDRPASEPEPLRARKCTGCGNVQLFAIAQPDQQKS